jgi:RHS repeat-associated protein
VLTRTDARGATASYTYDSLNRVTQAVYSRSGYPSETHSFTYDTGTYGKGHLTQLVDTAGTTTWTYTQQGRVASKTQLVGSLTSTVALSYNTAGQVITLTTPSGQVLGYTYLNNRIASITVNGSALLSNAETDPFGPTSAWQWGNGLKTYRDHDLDGRVVTWEFRNGVSVLRNDLAFDLASRVTTITDPANATLTQAYQYDALDRITQAQTGVPAAHTQQFSYDVNGNRLSTTTDGNAGILAYATISNQLQTLTGNVPADYLAGNTNLSYIYDNANRLATVTTNGATTVAAYKVNALGQRVQKTVGSSTTNFVYDEQGHLLGEYEGSGSLIQETVWLEGLPVATLKPNGTGTPTPIAIYYVHSDHLGTPRAITLPSTNALMWRWDNVDAFGDQLPDENPSGQGTFGYNLRFPGQYYDAETGTNYNYHRDYDPAIGRYLQSDRIGLHGGLNTYGYVQQNPLSSIDRTGDQIAIPFPPIIGIGGPIGAVIGIGLSYLISEMCKQPCPPCKTISGKTVPVGTPAYRPLDTPDKPEHGITGPHYNIYKANQNTNNCRCFWQPMGAVAPSALPPNAIPIEPFVNPE